MTLTLPHLLARSLFFHQTLIMALPLLQAPTSETGIGLLKFSTIHFLENPSVQATLKTCQDSKTQYSLVIRHASGSRTVVSEGIPPICEG